MIELPFFYTASTFTIQSGNAFSMEHNLSPDQDPEFLESYLSLLFLFFLLALSNPLVTVDVPLNNGDWVFHYKLNDYTDHLIRIMKRARRQTAFGQGL